MKGITEAQLEIFNLLERGLSVGQIAGTLSLHESSVSAQIRRIQKKVKAGTFLQDRMPMLPFMTEGK